MRITIPIDVWEPGRGGLEAYLALLSRSLQERGHEVTVYCARDLSGAAGSGSAPTVEVIPLPRSPRWIRELLFARRCVERHRASGADLLYAVRHALEADVYQPHGGSYRSAVRTSLIGASPLRRLVKSVFRLLRPTYHALAWLDAQVFRRSPGVLTLSLSRVVEESLESSYPDVPLRFIRIYNGIPLDRFHDRDRDQRAQELRSRFGIPADAPVALFLAHQFAAKGLAHAILALRDAGSWHLVVGGRGRPKRFLAQARSLQLEDRVHFAGAIREPRKAYAGSDAFVLPTSYDSCSLSVLEAMACGVPAITTRQNGAAELIDDSRDGFVIGSPRDGAAISTALREIAAQREPFRVRALESATRFSWETHVDRLLLALESRRDELDA